MKRSLKYIGILLGFIIGLVLILCASWYTPDTSVAELEKKYFTKESSYVSIDDSKIHIRKRGSGPVLFLLHGSFASLHTWNAWEEKLKNDFTTVSVDFPGHGLTGPSKTEKYSTDNYESLIIHLADHLKIDTFFVAGNSMGGQVAWKLALHYPERVKKLILVDAAGYWKITSINPNEKQKRPFIFTLLQNDVLGNLLIKITPRFLFNWNLKQVYGDPKKVKEPDVDRFYDLMMRDGNREATLKRLRQPGKDLQDSIKKIKAPTLIIWGKLDRWIPLQNAHNFKRDINQSDLQIVETGGHIPMEELPNETAQLAINFLQNKPRKQGQN